MVNRSCIEGVPAEMQLGWEQESLLTSRVRDFMNKFGLLNPDEPYTTERLIQRDLLLEEEFNEYKDAVAAKDPIAKIDALCDIVFVAIGTALAEGWDFDAHYLAVCEANMAKERGTKSTRPNSGGFDVIKPKDWVGPETTHMNLMGHHPTS
jgi:predicted HAD superfamily Cof-like phosphohydrolase